MQSIKFRLKLIVHFCAVLLLIQLGSAQEARFRITLLHPVEELRAEALKAEPPQEQGSFRQPELVELVKLDSSVKLDIRYATANNVLGHARITNPAEGSQAQSRLRRRPVFVRLENGKRSEDA
jgi:hypothetical protein